MSQLNNQQALFVPVLAKKIMFLFIPSEIIALAHNGAMYMRVCVHSLFSEIL